MTTNIPDPQAIAGQLAGSDTKQKKSSKKRRLAAIAALIALAGAAWYGGHWWSTGRFLEHTDDAYVGADITVVTAKVPGYIRQVMVTDNQMVRAGDVLAILDDGDYRAALARAEGAVAAAQALVAGQPARGNSRAQAEAVLAQALAERDIARLNLGHTVLRAPIDGSIGNRHARTGGFAAAGSQLLSVVPARGLWIDANFKESQLAGMAPGQRVKVEADVKPGHVFHGTVASLAPATGAQFSILPPENATGNFTKIVQRVPVRIVLDSRDATLGTLRPGLSVTAEVDMRPAAGGSQ